MTDEDFMMQCRKHSKESVSDATIEKMTEKYYELLHG
jgi:hypothetical protein